MVIWKSYWYKTVSEGGFVEEIKAPNFSINVLATESIKQIQFNLGEKDNPRIINDDFWLRPNSFRFYIKWTRVTWKIKSNEFCLISKKFNRPLAIPFHSFSIIRSKCRSQLKLLPQIRSAIIFKAGTRITNIVLTIYLQYYR